MLRRWVEDSLFGRRRLQPLYARLHGLALAGMNFSRAWNVKTSGEARVIERLHGTFSRDQPRIVFDVGASVGSYSRQVLSTFGDLARVHAFEPSRDAFERLRQNLAGCSNVSLHNLGLGDRECDACLFADAVGSATASLYPAHARSDLVQEKVRLTRLDDFCHEKDIARIHLLKVDTEGHELAVLRGAARLLAAQRIDVIQFEVGASTIDARAYFRDFFDLLHLTHRLYRIVCDGLVPIGDYHPKHEVFLTINYLAVALRHAPLR
jgi:FkbM family methyltransferase